jgi:hypothetical protein
VIWCGGLGTVATATGDLSNDDALLDSCYVWRCSKWVWVTIATRHRQR